jgi:hypothetical protein
MITRVLGKMVLDDYPTASHPRNLREKSPRIHCVMQDIHYKCRIDRSRAERKLAPVELHELDRRISVHA